MCRVMMGAELGSSGEVYKDEIFMAEMPLYISKGRKGILARPEYAADTEDHTE